MAIKEEMLAIAELCIESVARHHGYAPGQYDTQVDPDDFSAAILTGLRHWCDATGESWAGALGRATWSYRHDLNGNE